MKPIIGGIGGEGGERRDDEDAATFADGEGPMTLVEFVEGQPGDGGVGAIFDELHRPLLRDLPAGLQETIGLPAIISAFNIAAVAEFGDADIVDSEAFSSHSRIS